MSNYNDILNEKKEIKIYKNINHIARNRIPEEYKYADWVKYLKKDVLPVKMEYREYKNFHCWLEGRRRNAKREIDGIKLILIPIYIIISGLMVEYLNPDLLKRNPAVIIIIVTVVVMVVSRCAYSSAIRKYDFYSDVVKVSRKIKKQKKHNQS